MNQEEQAGRPSLKTLNARTAAEYEHRLRDLAGDIGRRFRTQDAPAAATPLSRLRDRVSAAALDGAPLEPEALRRELDQLVLEESVWFHHPDYLAHLNCPVDLNAVLAESVLASVNPSVDTFDQSRVGTLIERRLIEWTAGRIGFPDGDGVFTSGGTQSNLQALFLAREAALDGRTGADRWELQRRLVLFTSPESHFSLAKGALVLGLPDDAVVPVATDAEGRMDPRALEAAVRRARAAGRVPFLVGATAGTTDRGVIDPLERIAEVCAGTGVRLHVDAAYGGGLLVSRRHRQALRGIERADSVTVDFHKTFFQPVSSSAVVLRDRRDFSRGAWHADYLNPEDGAAPNQVDKSLQTTRRFDALKLWATLRGTGADAIGDALDRLIGTTARVHRGLAGSADLRLLSGTDLTTVLFRWQPAGVSDAEADRLVDLVRDELLESGRLYVARTVLAGRPCLKLTILNPETDAEHILARLRDVADCAARRHRAARPVPALVGEGADR